MTTTKLAKVELIIRDILLALCAFMFFYAWLEMIAKSFMEVKIFHVPFYLIILLIISYPVGKSFRMVAADVFHEDDEDWEDEDEEFKTKFLLLYRCIGVILLYFMVQLIIAYFAEPYISIPLFKTPSFIYLFSLLNCAVICSFYKKYIL